MVGIWTGDIKKPIYLKTKIEHHTGKMKTEMDWKLNSEYGKDISTDSFIEIANNSGEKFILSMDFEKQGFYNVEVEFTYMYDGKTRTIKTEPHNCIFLDKEENQ